MNSKFNNLLLERLPEA